MSTFNFLLYALSLRFLTFDYKYSPVQIYLQTATNPILATLAKCSFCQGCEVGFAIQLLVFEHTPSGIAIAFLNAIAAGYTSYVVGLILERIIVNHD
jgi:hypothetical protein